MHHSHGSRFYGFWCFLIGGIFVCGSLFFDVAPARRLVFDASAHDYGVSAGCRAGHLVVGVVILSK